MLFEAAPARTDTGSHFINNGDLEQTPLSFSVGVHGPKHGVILVVP